MKEYVCPECGKPCDAKQCDDGIGPVEFWGAKSHDSRPYTGSDCCDAELEDANAFDDLDARADYEYEQRRDRELEERDAR